ncbi:MAG TPA: hypothetical protein VHM28_02490 [Anaerolineales bacterium]|jgi:hypothetical protein|nr:hypothetical protein [Anaerolineales bacterium]
MKRLVLLALLFLAACNYPGLTTSPPASDSPGYGNCYYNWAEHDIASLSEKLNKALQAIDRNLTGSAYAYGEDCVYEDGHSTFGAMETDFRVQVKVKDLKDEKALGDWISKTLQAIEALPPDEIQGPQPGKVQFHFIESETEDLYLNVSLKEYESEAKDLKGAELFRYFYKNP